MSVAKEQIRQIIIENNINSVSHVCSLLKDSFKDILLELLEAEMDVYKAPTESAVRSEFLESEPGLCQL